jgi:hypothetical protein
MDAEGRQAMPKREEVITKQKLPSHSTSKAARKCYGQVELLTLTGLPSASTPEREVPHRVTMQELSINKLDISDLLDGEGLSQYAYKCQVSLQFSILLPSGTASSPQNPSLVTFR